MNIPIKIAVGTDSEVLDMFKDEGISIKTMVKDMSDPKKLFTDFSRTFTVPASKKNNRIFKHYYNIDITNGLDTRELVPAKILMANTTYKVGNIRVESSKMQYGIAENYKVTFIGKLSELSRQIGQDKLSILDFSNLDLPDYDFVTQLTSLTKRDLMFPLSSRSDRYLADSVTKSLGIEGATNILYSGNGSLEDYGVREKDIVGALSVGAIIDKIESRYGFNFTGVLNDAGYVRDLYLWLHQTAKQRQGERYTAFLSSLAVDTASGTGTASQGFLNTSTGIVFFPYFALPDYDGTQNKWELRVSGTFSGNCTIKLRKNSQVVRTVDVSNTSTESFNLELSMVGDRFDVEVESDSNETVAIRISTTQYYLYEYETGGNGQWGGGATTHYQWRYESFSAYNGQVILGTSQTYAVGRNLPTMTIMDFLSSIFKMFNIVAEVDEDLNISTKHFDHYMSQGSRLKDLSEYVDVSNYNISRPNVYSSLNMGFEEPKLALEQGYASVNGRNYGEISYSLTGANGVRLSGGAYDLKVKNQRTPLEPLIDLSDDSDVNICYTQFSDLKGSEQSIKPMFTYISKQHDSSRDIAIYDPTVPATIGRNNFSQPCNIYTPSQLPPSEMSMELGLFFGEELNEYDVNTTQAGLGLWSNFYRGTTALMFDEDKRRVKLNSYMPQSVLIDLQPSDNIEINNHFYNINSLETNYLTGKTKLDLTLVGRARLIYFEPRNLKVTNNHATKTLYFTYVDYNTGLIARGFELAGNDGTYPVVGKVTSFNHNEFTDEVV